MGELMRQAGRVQRMVQDLVIAAANAALTKAREHVDTEIEKITGGRSIPGLG